MRKKGLIPSLFTNIVKKDIFSKEKSYNLSPVLLFSIEGIPRQLTGTTLGSIAYFYLRKSAAQKK